MVFVVVLPSNFEAAEAEASSFYGIRGRLHGKVAGQFHELVASDCYNYYRQQHSLSFLGAGKLDENDCYESLGRDVLFTLR